MKQPMQIRTTAYQEHTQDKYAKAEGLQIHAPALS